MEINKPTPLSFEDAITKAKENLRLLYPTCYGSQLKQAVIDNDKKTYEITYSFNTITPDDLSPEEEKQISSALQLFQLMNKHRRIKKIFLIDFETGIFKGLKESNN